MEVEAGGRKAVGWWPGLVAFFLFFGVVFSFCLGSVFSGGVSCWVALVVWCFIYVFESVLLLMRIVLGSIFEFEYDQFCAVFLLLFWVPIYMVFCCCWVFGWHGVFTVSG